MRLDMVGQLSEGDFSVSSDHMPAARHPGEVLAEVLAGRGLTAYRIAAVMRIPYERTYPTEWEASFSN